MDVSTTDTPPGNEEYTPSTFDPLVIKASDDPNGTLTLLATKWCERVGSWDDLDSLAAIRRTQSSLSAYVRRTFGRSLGTNKDGMFPWDTFLLVQEMNRRSERRMAQLIRKGQAEGWIQSKGRFVPGKKSPKTWLGTGASFFEFAEVNDERWEELIDDGRRQGQLGYQWLIDRLAGKPDPKVALATQRRNTDANRVFREATLSLIGLADHIELVDPASLTPETIQEWGQAFKKAVRKITHHSKEILNHGDHNE